MPRGSKRSKQERIRNVESEVDAFLEQSAAASSLERIPDHELFQLDTSKRASRLSEAPSESRVRVFRSDRPEIKPSKGALAQMRKVAAKSRSSPREVKPASMLRTVDSAVEGADLWDETSHVGAPKGFRGEDPPAVELQWSSHFHHPGVKGRTLEPEAQRKHPRSVPLSKSVPSVIVPAPGLSYNPLLADHQDALGEALANELEWQAKREKEIAARDSSQPYSRSIARVHEYSDSEEELDDAALGVVRGAANPPVVVKRKTTVQRNREKRVREGREAEEREAKFAKVVAEAASHRALGRKARAEEEERSRRQAAREVERLARLEAMEPRVLKKGSRGGGMERKPREGPLTADLGGSLRLVKSTGASDPVQDRWNALLLQDRLEVSVKKQGKLRRRKKVIGRHKD
jgi:hypothetical protein